MRFIDKYGNYVNKPDDAPVIPKISAYGILIVGDYILLTQDHDLDFKEAPGGTVEPGEEVLEALVYEIREETGFNVQVDNPNPICSVSENFYDNDTYYTSTREVYIVSLADNTIDIENIFSNEIASFGFYHIKTLSDVSFQGYLKDAIHKHLQIT